MMLLSAGSVEREKSCIGCHQEQGGSDPLSVLMRILRWKVRTTSIVYMLVTKLICTYDERASNIKPYVEYM
jgi:hypothetical protein